MPGGVASPAQGLADVPYLDLELRIQGVENAGFSYAGVSCKGRQLTSYLPFQFLQPLPVSALTRMVGNPAAV